MKRILVFAILIASAIGAYSQTEADQLNRYLLRTLDLNQLGVLFAKDHHYGTARFESMSGAFGALGTDISAFSINPAGSAVSKKSSASFTLANRSTDTGAQYYGNTFNSQNNHFNVSQAGAILAFDTGFNSDWNRFAFTVNYKLKSDFDNSYLVEGSGIDNPFFDQIPNNTDTNNLYDQGISDTFHATQRGHSSVVNLGFSTVHQNKLFLGASLNFHNIELNRITSLNEINENNQGDLLNFTNTFESIVEANGFSLGLGLIYKFNKNLRFGVAYESPTWYTEIIDDTNLHPDELYPQHYMGDFDYSVNNGLPSSSSEDIYGNLISSLRTNSRVTLSGAYIFGKRGLISIDYTYRNYPGIRYGENNIDFVNVNRFFNSDYRASHSLSIGTEWRFDRLSVRGGYLYEKNPNLLAQLGGNTNKDNLRGISTGLGYNFGNTKIDLSYRRLDNQDYQSVYGLGDVILNNNTSRITGTITFTL